MMLATNATALSATSASRAFGNGRARSGAFASSRGVVVASKTPSARLQRADWARTVSAVGNGGEPSRGAGNARGAARDGKRGSTVGRSAVAVRDDPIPLSAARARAWGAARLTRARARAPRPSRSIRTSLSIVRERVTRRRARFSDPSWIDASGRASAPANFRALSTPIDRAFDRI
jgi:hypothetical protein